MSVDTKALEFDLPDSLAATAPPEARGLRRDQVRLLVAAGHDVRHVRFADLPDQLSAGDLLVVNTSATMPAAVDGVLADRRRVAVHFATALDDGTWVVEVRPAGRADGPLRGLAIGHRVQLAAGATATVLAAYPLAAAPSTRLWRAAVSVADLPRFLARHGRPISYAYVPRRWPLESYQTVFAAHPGSAEMPSAGRPFSTELVTALVTRGIRIAPITLHTGVSSAERGEPPAPERYEVPRTTAELVDATRAAGHRVVAVGTTVTRALETRADPSGWVTAGAGWTDLVLGVDRPARVVDGLVTGWHAPGASHLQLLEAVAGPALVAAAYEHALRHGYRWHEFGDSALLLPEPSVLERG